MTADDQDELEAALHNHMRRAMRATASELPADLDMSTLPVQRAMCSRCGADVAALKPVLTDAVLTYRTKCCDADARVVLHPYVEIEIKLDPEPTR